MIWPQELLEIEAYYGIPVEDSWALCTAEDVSCYWNSETFTFQSLWSGLEEKYDGNLADVLFYLDPVTEMQCYPQMTAKLSNESLTDPVDREKYQQRGGKHTQMVLLFDKDDERRARLFTTSAEVLTHIYE